MKNDDTVNEPHQNDQSLEGIEDFQQAIALITESAKRSIKLFTQSLNHHIYDSDRIADAFIQPCRKNKLCSVSIIVNDISKVVTLGHRLANLQQRFPSLVEIRSLPQEYQTMADEFLVVDEIAYLKKYAHGELKGTCSIYAPAEARTLNRLFAEIWERSTVCREISRLSL